MNMKKGLLCLLVVTVSSLCVVNVTAALPHNPTAAPHSKNEANVKTTTRTTLTFNCPTQATVNEHLDIGGSLTAGGTGVSGAHINNQWLNQGQWTNFGYGHDTDSNGNFSGWLNFSGAGTYTVRLSYDGDSQYGPSVSNEVTITVS